MADRGPYSCFDYDRSSYRRSYSLDSSCPCHHHHHHRLCLFLLDRLLFGAGSHACRSRLPHASVDSLKESESKESERYYALASASAI